MLARNLTCVLLAAASYVAAARASEPMRLGLLHTLSPAPFYIAQELGYFRNAGIELTFRFYEAAQPIAAAVASGEVDVGVTALTGGFFNLAQKGTLKVIAGALHEQKGYHGSAILASNRAFDAGLTDARDLPGHSFAVTQYGSSFHYMLGRIAEVQRFDIKSVTLQPQRQISSMIAAVSTGQVDATIAIASIAKPLSASGQLHIVGWISDLVPYQITTLFTRTALIANRSNALQHFAAAYQLGVADYREAFFRQDAVGAPVVDEKTDAAITLLTKYVFTDDPDARRKILDGFGYYDVGGALDVADVLEQARWFKAKGLTRDGGDAAAILDTRFFPTR